MFFSIVFLSLCEFNLKDNNIFMLIGRIKFISLDNWTQYAGQNMVVFIHL